MVLSSCRVWTSSHALLLQKSWLCWNSVCGGGEGEHRVHERLPIVIPRVPPGPLMRTWCYRNLAAEFYNDGQVVRAEVFGRGCPSPWFVGSLPWRLHWFLPGEGFWSRRKEAAALIPGALVQRVVGEWMCTILIITPADWTANRPIVLAFNFTAYFISHLRLLF